MAFLSWRRNRSVQRLALLSVLVGAAYAGVLLASCATVGRDFPTEHVSQIEIGKTTQADIEKMFGAPWRTGIEDGQRTWTYGKYKYSIAGKTSSRDLVVRFDKNNVVSSYTFSTTEPQTGTTEKK
jgi:SmpA / OmlA family